MNCSICKQPIESGEIFIVEYDVHNNYKMKGYRHADCKEEQEPGKYDEYKPGTWEEKYERIER